ncbi:MAG TPA: glycosyltransferase [Patescibacteria group bacterium]|nr:glycosyltransferase [Patescibacteria group bacterium]
MKRIAMISYHTCPLAALEGKESGGMNVYVTELSRQLARQGHQVDVFTRSQDKDNKPVVEVEKGFRVIHVVAGPEVHIPKKELRQYIPDFVAGVKDFCAKEKTVYDVVHAHYYLSGLIAKLVWDSAILKIPFIMTFHTLALMKNMVARDETEKEDQERIESEMSLAHDADRIIAPSISDAQYLQYLYDVPASRIVLIPPGVDADIFRPIDAAIAKKKIDISPDAHLVVFVGRIEPLKGIDVLIYAMKILTSRNPSLPVSLVIVGGDVTSHPSLWSKTLQSLDSVRKTLNLTASVHFVHQQKQEMLPYYYNAADIVVMPSHYESFGLAALEAMACGVPVIMSNVTGISTLIDEKHSSLITSVNNPLLLATQMEEFIRDKDKRESVGRSIRESIMDLTWKNIASRVDAVYDQLLLENVK